MIWLRYIKIMSNLLSILCKYSVRENNSILRAFVIAYISSWETLESHDYRESTNGPNRENIICC